MFYSESKLETTPIGNVPKDWQVVALGKFLSLRNGERPRTSENGHIPVYGANGIMGYTGEVLVEKDFTIVIGRVGASGEVHLARGKNWVSDNAIYSEDYSGSTVYLPFVFYLLKFKKLSQFASKTTQPIITQTFLKNFLIQLPSLPEQRKIADVLSTVDEAVQKTDELIAKTERLKKGLMKELLTRGIGHKEFKDTEIGRIPRDWIVSTLGNILLDIRYGTSVRATIDGDGFPVLGIPNVLGGEIDEEKVRSAKLSEAELRSLVLEDGDIILVRTNANPDYIGRCALFERREGTWLYASYLIRIRPDQNRIVPRYLVKFLQSDVARKQFLSIARTSAGNYNINVEGIQSIVMCMPSLSEQVKIAEVLLAVDEKLKLERKLSSKLRRIRNGFMDLLLTGQVRVKVN